jgi:membrane fusion protein (multidrug efflux system)
MNKSVLLGISLATLMAACGSEPKDPKAELVALKKQQKEIQDKISMLESKDPKKESVRKVPVRIQAMSPSVFYNYIDVQGTVDVDEKVDAIPENPMGIIESILVRPGQYVRKGQVVARLRAESVDKGIAQIDQQIEFAKTVYDKQKRLWDEEIGTEIQLLSAKNNYESLLKQKQTVLSQKTAYVVYSPINGVVDAVDATVGQSFANPVTGPHIRIINTGKLKIVAEIPENYSSVVRSGSNCQVVISRY